MNQIERIKENIEWRNENIKEETYATHMAFDSIEQIIESEETEINSLILDNITPQEKFQIICRAKGFDIDEIASDIYGIIENSPFEDVSQYIGIGRYQDEYMDDYDVHILNIDSYMLDTFDDWAKSHMEEYDLSYEECACLDWDLYVFGDEFNEEQKEFIKLALKCKVESIPIKWFP